MLFSNQAFGHRTRVTSSTSSDKIVSVAFGVRAQGENDYNFLGTADSAPYRVFPARGVIANAPELEFKAIARDLFGKELKAEFEWHRRILRRPGR